MRDEGCHPQHEIVEVEKERAACEEEIALLKQKIREEREYIQGGCEGLA